MNTYLCRSKFKMMIKKAIFAITVLLAIALKLEAQETSNPVDTAAPPLDFQRQAFIYGMAKKYGDADMTKSALYNILAMNPNNVSILDSLALLYFEYQEYASAAIVSQDIIALNPDDMLATEIAAVSFENLGVKDRALPYYEKLQMSNNNISLLYQIAFIQYELNRLIEAKSNIEIILADPQIENVTLLFSKTQTETQEVPLKAAIHRLNAMIAQSEGNIEEAKNQFNKALEIVPDFEVVKIQMQSLN